VDLIRGLSSYAGELTAAADLTRLPFEDGCFDVVIASHVLEHIQDDRAAIGEIFRVLGIGGIAILPVPIVHSGRTVEYGAPRPDEEMHVRAPGLDYFDRFTDAGFRVQSRCSSDFPERHQLLSFHEVVDDPAANGGKRAGRPGTSGSEQWMPICRRPLPVES
jgi:SAM-dependent methyltransferase